MKYYLMYINFQMYMMKAPASVENLSSSQNIAAFFDLPQSFFMIWKPFTGRQTMSFMLAVKGGGHPEQSHQLLPYKW